MVMQWWKYLPYGIFKRINPNDSFKSKILNIIDDSDVGYTFEVGLEYLEQLHDLHSDFPLTPKNNIDINQLSKSSTILYDKKKYFTLCYP